MKCLSKKNGIVYRAGSDQNKNYNERPEGVIIDTVIIHYTAHDYDHSYECLTTKVSAHYLIREDGTIDDLVDDAKRAWHAGVSSWRDRENVNDFSIGIEIVNLGSGDNRSYPTSFEGYDGFLQSEIRPFTEVQMESLIELLGDLKEKYPAIKDCNIIGHGDICAYNGRKIDPGVAFDWGLLHDSGHGVYSHAVLENIQALLYAGNKGEDVVELQCNLQEMGYKITQTGEFDENTANVVRAFNMHYNSEWRLKCDVDSMLHWDVWDSQGQVRLLDIIEAFKDIQDNEFIVIDV